jgi:hypothetical protein
MANVQPVAVEETQHVMGIPVLKDVLDAADLHTITHYMDVHRQTVATFIVN